MAAAPQIDRYRALLDSARCFGRAMDHRSLLAELLKRAQQVMDAEGCTILLPDPRTGELVLYTTDPVLEARPERLRVAPGSGIAGAVFESRQIINVQDAASDSRHYRVIGDKVGFVTHAMLSIPLLDGSECLGVMQVLNPLGRESFDAEDEEIFVGFGALIANALVRLEAQKLEVQQARARQELDLAREIQDSYLPAEVQSLPFARINAHYYPAYAVGGDFYVVHRLEENRLLVALGDVTGKGIPAALTMARAMAMIQAMLGQLEDDLGRWVTSINRQFAADLRGGRFIGMTFLLANATTAELQVCAAGQFPPLHHDGQAWTLFPSRRHLPLGISDGVSFVSDRAPLKPSHLWLLFSDGFPEARNEAGDDFTLERFIAALPSGLTGAEALEAGVNAWRAFSGQAVQHDDASVLLLDWRGSPPPAQLETSCCPENLANCRDFIERWAVYAGFGDIAAGQIVAACDEAVSNVFRHGYHQRPGPLRIEVKLQDGIALVICILDDAPPSDASQFHSRDLTELRPGGLGTFIMSHVFDELHYEPRPEGGTRLRLTKRLPAPPAP